MAEDLRYQLLPSCEPGEADVLVLPVPHEGAVCGGHGTAGAPAAILQASAELEYYEEDAGWSPMRHLRLAVLPEVSAPAGGDEAALHAHIEQRARELPGAAPEQLLIALGGDHSITPSLVAGRLQEPATIVFLDAHADLRERYMGSEHSHACPAHRLRAQGHRLILVGVRSMFDAEARRIADDAGIELFADRALQRPEERARLLARVEALQGPVWLTTDMDVFDPALVPGVGTPQPGGLGWHFAVDLLEALLLRSGASVHGADIVELVPEASRVSQLIAAKWMQKVISFWGKGRGLDRGPERGSQLDVRYE